MLGGYKLINLRGIDVSGVGKTIDGIYEAIEGTNKATLITGLVIGSEELDDLFVPFRSESTSFVGKVMLGTATLTITVSSENLVVGTIG